MSEEKKLTDIKFFICSTVNDLSEYRKSVINRIKKEEGKINAQEFFGARDNKPIETCLGEVEKSDIFIMFIAFRRGSIEQTTGKSFVELEYEKAKELGLKKLVYFLDNEHPWPHKHVDDGEESIKLKNFKDLLKKELTIDNFTTKDDLSSKVISDLFNRLPEWGFNIDTTKGEASLKLESLTALDLFQKLPKVYYGQEHEIDVELGNFYKANEDECKAFSMTYGATIKRTFRAINKELDEKLDNQMKLIFASYEYAEELVSLPKGQKISVKVKTIEGENKKEEPIYKLIPISPIGSSSITGSVTSLSLNSFQNNLAQLVPPTPKKIIIGYKEKREYFYGLKYIGIKK